MGDWYDSEPDFDPGESPGCGLCADSGRETMTGRRCRDCDPSMLRVWWYTARWYAWTRWRYRNAEPF